VRLPLSLLTAAVVVALAVGCGDDGGSSPTSPTPTTPTTPANRAPATSGSIPSQTLTAGESAMVDVAQYFIDPDGDALTYAATSSNATVAAVSVSASTVNIDAQDAGEANVTVTARDPGNMSATQQFSVTVEAPDPRILALGLAVDSIRSGGDGVQTATGTNIDEARLRVGEEIILSARVTCDDGEVYTAGRFDAPCFTATDPVDWKSSDTGVATVELGYSDVFAHDSAGIVRGIGLGEGTITVDFKGHSTGLKLEVVAEGDESKEATKDRQDDTSGEQVHFVYAFASNETGNRRHDRAHELSYIAAHMQEWLENEAGMRWRLDTYRGALDVSILPIHWRGENDSGDIVSAFETALRRREGSLNRNKKYAVFFDYDGSLGVFPVNGVASDNVAVTLMDNPLHQATAGTAIHEIIHTFGAVASCAPNATPGSHVDDNDHDIMAGGGVIGGLLDWNRDDYFRHGNAGCLDIADVAFWERTGMTNSSLTRSAEEQARPSRSTWSFRMRCGGYIR